MIEEQNTLAEKFIRKWFWLYFFSFIMAPIWYAIKIIISWELSVADVWILYWVMSFIILVSAYNDLWITESLYFYIPKFILEKRYDRVKFFLFYAILIQIITWVSIALFFFYWADFLANNYFHAKPDEVKKISDVFKIFSFFFLSINIFQIITSFFMAIQNTFYSKVTDLIRMCFTLFFVLWLFLLDKSSLIGFSYSWLFWLVIWTLIAVNTFYNKYYKIYLKSEKLTFDKSLAWEIVKYASLIFITAEAWTILSQIDMQLIIYMLWAEPAWYYTNYLSMIWIPFMIIWPIFWLLFPIFSEMHWRKDYVKIKLIKQIFTKNFLIIWIWFNILFFVFAETISSILFWEKFIPSWTILKYSVLFLIFNFMLQINFNIMAWIWKVKDRLRIIVVAIIFNFILNIILIKEMWVEWSALATWIWWILIWVLSEYYLWKEYFVNYDFNSLFKNTIIMWIIWFLSYEYVVPYFYWLSRQFSFIYMLIFTVLYFLIFTLVNLREFKIFLWEVKKIRK